MYLLEDVRTAIIPSRLPIRAANPLPDPLLYESFVSRVSSTFRIIKAGVRPGRFVALLFLHALHSSLPLR